VRVKKSGGSVTIRKGGLRKDVLKTSAGKSTMNGYRALDSMVALKKITLLGGDERGGRGRKKNQGGRRRMRK